MRLIRCMFHTHSKLYNYSTTSVLLMMIYLIDTLAFQILQIAFDSGKNRPRWPFHISLFFEMIECGVKILTNKILVSAGYNTDYCLSWYPYLVKLIEVLLSSGWLGRIWPNRLSLNSWFLWSSVSNNS